MRCVVQNKRGVGMHLGDNHQPESSYVEYYLFFSRNPVHVQAWSAAVCSRGAINQNHTSRKIQVITIGNVMPQICCLLGSKIRR